MDIILLAQLLTSEQAAVLIRFTVVMRVARNL